MSAGERRPSRENESQRVFDVQSGPSAPAANSSRSTEIETPRSRA
jgi:hypothetical protein